MAATRTCGLWLRAACAISAGAVNRHVRADELLVTGWLSNSVPRYGCPDGAAAPGSIPAGSGGIANPHHVLLGPDGLLYVASTGNSRVLRLEHDGVFRDTFINGAGTQLSAPTCLAFGPDGNLYVGSGFNHRVFRFDSQSGALLNVAALDPTLVAPIGLAFAPDGGLLVASFSTDRIVKFDPTSGALTQTLELGNGLDHPVGLAVGPDAQLYVASGGTRQVLRYDISTGEYLDAFGTLPAPPGGPFFGTAFNLDGELLVSDSGRSDPGGLPSRPAAPPS